MPFKVCRIIRHTFFAGHTRQAAVPVGLGLAHGEKVPFPSDMEQAFAHKVKKGRILDMKHKEYIYAGESVPEITEQEQGEFLLNVQKAILFSLEKRNLLTQAQRESCCEKLEQRRSPGRTG